MPKNKLLTVLRYLGYVFALVSVAYMYSVAKGAVLHPPPFTTLTVAIVVVLLCGHVAFPFISASVWRLTVELASRKRMSFRDATSIYVRTNIAKYLPGNVFQYAGRNYVGVRYGWTHLQLALGSFLDLVCGIAIPFGILAVLGVSRLWTLPESYVLRFTTLIRPATVLISIVILAVIAVAAGAYLKSTGALLGKALTEFTSRAFLKQFVMTVFQIAILSFGSMLLSTAFFYLIASSLLGVHFRGGDFINIACSLTAAGYAGVLTPGLPGGIGVKESISVVLISGYGYDKAALVAVSICARAFSVVGEIAAFFIASRFSKPHPPVSNDLP